MTLPDLVVALVIAIGLVGILLPVLPGVVLVFAAIVGWGVVEATGTGWTVVAVAVTLLAASQVLKYVIPGRRLRDVGVPRSTLAVGAVVGVVGFFVIPVIGLVIGFIAGVYAAEWYRLHDHRPAAASTLAAVRAVGLSILIELVGALLATAVWAVGVVVA
jgi:uncharacterized protein